MDNKELRSRVLKNLIYITQNTTNIGMLNMHLIQNEVILPVDKETIESVSPQESQVYNLMLLVTKKGPGTSEKVLEALRQTGNKHIADVLDSNNKGIQNEFSKQMTLDLSNTSVDFSRINPLLDKVQELVDVLRVEDIIAASKTKYISVKEEPSDDGKKHVAISQVDVPKAQNEIPRIEIPTIKKVIVVGDGATGKTCMNVVWMSGVFPDEYVPTVFDNYETILKVKGSLIQLGIWDTAGQEEYDKLRPLSYPRSDVCIIVFAIDNIASLENVVEKWIPEIRYHCPKVPIIVVGTKIDLRSNEKSVIEKRKDKIVTTNEEGRNMAEIIGAREYLECSAKTGEGMQSILPVVLRIALENV